MVAGVAYLDPGNVASNASAGARLRIPAGLGRRGRQHDGLADPVPVGEARDQHRREPARHPRRNGSRGVRARYAFWVQAELVAMATDVAEVLGGAIALNLLFDLPLLVGGLITGTVSMLLLLLHSRRGSRSFESVIIGLVAIIAIGFCAGIFFAPLDPAAAAAGLVPRFADSGSVLLAASIMGATVMPHAIYAHSALTRDRFGLVAEGVERRRVLRATRIDVTVALAIAGTVNVVILLLAAVDAAGGGRHQHPRGGARRDQRSPRPRRRDAVRGRPAGIRSRVDERRAPTPGPRSCGGCCTSRCRCWRVA